MEFSSLQRGLEDVQRATAVQNVLLPEKVESLCSRVVACLPSLSLVSASLGSDTGQVSTEYLLYMIITENIDFIQA